MLCRESVDRLSTRTLLAALAVCGVSLAGWQLRAELPRWMQDAVSASAIESALYRAMDLPGVKALYPRPPKESEGELSGLIGKATEQAALYSLRALQEEQALDFDAAEKDWKTYAAKAPDTIPAKIELANYYGRRVQARQEIETLMEVGSSAPQAKETYIAPQQQQSWKAFEEVLKVAADEVADEHLRDDLTAKAYVAWRLRYPQQSILYARELRWLVDEKQYDAAAKLIAPYRRAFPQDAVFPVKAEAMIEYRRGSSASIEKALTVYDRNFAPLWPGELVESYYSLLKQTHQQRRFTAEARARLAQNPDDLNAMARLFYGSQQQGNLSAALGVVDAYRASKDSRKASWSAEELYTLARLTTDIHAYAEAARYDFALYHAAGSLSSGSSPQVEGLSGMVKILLTAPEEPVELGSRNLSMYRDIATLDRGPGYWNGILSLWLNSTNPAQAYHQEEGRAQSYFHRAEAAELLAVLDRKYPTAPMRAELHAQLIHALADYGESAAVIKAGEGFLRDFPYRHDENHSDIHWESSRVAVAMLIADAYARTEDTTSEFGLYDRMLAELGAKASGMPLTAAMASSHGAAAPVKTEAESATAENGGDAEAGSVPATVTAAGEMAFEVKPGEPAGVSVDGAEEYQQLLERYLGRLTATGKLPEALAVLRRELDRNPNDPLLYERMASFLQQNNLSAQQEEVYQQAIRRFQDAGWYDKLARLYLREKKREAFASLTKQVTDIFHGSELEEYFSKSGEGGPQLFLQLNLYAHQRFPHDLVFVRNLLQAYCTKGTLDAAAREKLLREHWWEADDLRTDFFDALSKKGTLAVELVKLRALVPGAKEQRENPAAARELAEAEIWQSHFEASAPLLDTLTESYPADVEIGTQASRLFRSLAYFDVRETEHAVAVEKRLLAYAPGDASRLARIGDIYSDSGADAGPDHENLRAAAPYWRRMPLVHPGSPDGYLQAATVFWDYFQFDDALAEIAEARRKFDRPALFGYEAGAIGEGKRDYASAIHEYTGAALDGDGPSSARLAQLARRKATQAMVDEATAKAVQASNKMTALELRERVLKALKRDAEIGPLLESALSRATTFDQAQEIGTHAQAHALTGLYEHALERQITLAADPVQKIELAYELVSSYEERRDTQDAARVVANVYRDNPRLLGVVRATTDYYWRNKQGARAIDTLVEASKAAQPELARQLIVEAASKANESGSYEQARTLMTPLLESKSAEDAYNAQYLAVYADSYARAGDDAGLKAFYLAKLTAIRGAALPAEERREKTVLLRRGLIPALTRRKDYAGAMEQHAAILSAYPDDANVTQEAALYALRYGRQQQLVEFVSRTVAASPKDSRFAGMLAQVETSFENYPAAIDAYAHALAIRGDRSDWMAAKADLEERLQRLDDACADYQRLYALSYQNPDWMVKLAAARARQGRTEETVKALQRAWVDGHPPMASNDFRVAAQLETWNMLEESRRFAEMGVKAEGDELLTGGTGTRSAGDDDEGAAIYLRVMTRLRRQQEGLAVLDEARKAVEISPYAPGLLAEQVQKNGIASVTNGYWRRQRVEAQRQTAQRRFTRAVVAMSRVVGLYFTPEEKMSFAGLLQARAQAARQVEMQPVATISAGSATAGAVKVKITGGGGRNSAQDSGEEQAEDRAEDAPVGVSAGKSELSLWIRAAALAGLRDVEANLRRDVLLHAPKAGVRTAQLQPYIELQRSRAEYVELGNTLEAYAQVVKPVDRLSVLTQAEQAYRASGDEMAELRVLRQVAWNDKDAASLRERYLELLLKHDVAGFETFAIGSRDEATEFSAPNFAVAHSNLKIARAALNAHARRLDAVWGNGYSALVGLNFNDRSARTEGAFQQILGDATIGERLSGKANRARQLAGDDWFYYGMRYGVYRALAPESEWHQADPEDFLAADLERNPASAPNYAVLARAYADQGRTDAAIAEYGHALELAADSASVHDAMAVLLWKAGRKDEAMGHWREGLAALRRVEDKGPAPESFWSGFKAIVEHLHERGLTVGFRAEMDAVLRIYLARNGDYRSEELLRAVFLAAPTHAEGLAWVLKLIESAPRQAAILAMLDPETTQWLPRDVWEPLYLRQIDVARMEVEHEESGQEAYVTDYRRRRLHQLQQSLALFYVADHEDGKAEALINRMAAEQKQAAETSRSAVRGAEQEDAPLVVAKVVMASRGGRLGPLLASYEAAAELESASGSVSEPGAVPAAGVLRQAAGRLAAPGLASRSQPEDKPETRAHALADALAVWEFVFEREQKNHDLRPSDYLGLAEARLAVGDSAGAVAVLRRMALLPGDVYANYEFAAGLLEKKGRDAEAVEFLRVLAKGVPWNPSYALRLAMAEGRAAGKAAGMDSKTDVEAAATLQSVAASAAASFAVRTQAAMAIGAMAVRAGRSGNADHAAKLGSDELNVLAAGSVTSQQAQHPYFREARIRAAEGTGTGIAAQRTGLLRQAISIQPGDASTDPEAGYSYNPYARLNSDSEYPANSDLGAGGADTRGLDLNGNSDFAPDGNLDSDAYPGLDIPENTVGAAWQPVSSQQLRLRLFQAEAEAGHNAMALAVLEGMAGGSYRSLKWYSNDGMDSDEESADGERRGTGDTDEDNPDDSSIANESSVSTSSEALVAENRIDRRAQLERLAPLPVTGTLSDADELKLALTIATVRENVGDRERALRYLLLAAELQKDAGLRESLKHQAGQLQEAIALEAQNALRRPTIQKGLAQSGLVRPRLTAALAGAADKEAAR